MVKPTFHPTMIIFFALFIIFLYLESNAWPKMSAIHSVLGSRDLG